MTATDVRIERVPLKSWLAVTAVTLGTFLVVTVENLPMGLLTAIGGAASKADGESDLLAAIEEMPPADRALAERIHALVQKNAPELMPKTWYGQPAWATKAGKVVCFFQATAKFKTRYATFGFNEPAQLDDGTMWATSFALLDLSAADEKKLGALIKKAAG